MRSGRYGFLLGRLQSGESEPCPRAGQSAAAINHRGRRLAEEAERLGGAALPGVDQPVPVRVGFLVDQAACGIGIEPGDGSADALGVRHGGTVVRDEALDLGVVEHHADGLVANQAAARIGVAGGEEIARDVDEVAVQRRRLRPSCVYHWSQVITSSLVMWKAWPMACSRARRPTSPLAKSVLWVMTQRDEPSPGMITFLPRRMRSTAVYGFGPAVHGQGDLGVAVGVGGTDDGEGEALFAVGAHQAVFAGYLLARIVPVGIGEGRGFGDEVVPDGLLVGAGGADEDVLPGAAAEELEVAFDV